MTFARTRVSPRPALGVALAVCALGLWLAGGQPGQAATDSETQDVSATVTTSIQWGSFGGAAACTQAMGAQAFPSTAPGGSQTSSLFTGCVNSNATWGVTAEMTTPPEDADTNDTIGASAFEAYVVTPPTGVVPTCLLATPCSLDTQRTLISGAPVAPLLGPTLATNSFTYNLKLNVPGGQQAGEYVGGVVTFVASN